MNPKKTRAVKDQRITVDVLPTVTLAIQLSTGVQGMVVLARKPNGKFTGFAQRDGLEPVAPKEHPTVRKVLHDIGIELPEVTCAGVEKALVVLFAETQWETGEVT